MRIPRVLTVLSILVAASCFSSCAQTRATARSQNRIAVVDTEKVFDAYRKSQDRRTSIDDRANTLFNEGRDIKAQKTALDNELAKFEAGSPEYQEVERKIADLAARDKAFEEDLRKLYESRDNMIQEVNIEILREVRALAGDRGLDVVLEKRVVLKGTGRNPLAWPLTHYVRPGLEITTDLIERLNQRYLQAKNAGSSGAARQ